MKAMLLSFLLLFLQQGMGPGPGTAHSAGGGGGITFVQSAQNFVHSTAASISVSSGSPGPWSSSASGNLLVAICYTNAATGTMTIADNSGNTWTAGTVTHETTFNTSVFPFYLLTQTGGVTTITCTPSATLGLRMVAQEVHGLTGALDGTQQNNTTLSFASPAPWTAPSVTTTNANDILIAMIADGGGASYTAGAGWTLPANGTSGDSNSNAAIMYKIVSSTNTYASTGSASPGGGDNIMVSLFAFK